MKHLLYGTIIILILTIPTAYAQPQYHTVPVLIECQDKSDLLEEVYLRLNSGADWTVVGYSNNTVLMTITALVPAPPPTKTSSTCTWRTYAKTMYDIK